MQFLWGMINVLQLIVHIPLFSLSFPVNVFLIFSMIIDMSNFSFFKTDSVDSAFFSFTPTAPVNENFEAIGYESRNSIKNLGMLFWYIPSIGIMFGMLFIMGKLSKYSLR